MASTIKDYMIGLGFQVDSAAATRFASMLQSLEASVQRLEATIATATASVNSLVAALNGQADGLKKSGSAADEATNRIRSNANVTREAAKQHKQAARDINDYTKSQKDASLKTKLFGSSLTKMNPLLKTAQKLVRNLTAGFAVMNLVKLIKQTAQFNLGLEAQAKQLKKSYEETRAYQLALKTMGKTIQEINQDKNLKETYDRLLGIGKDLALPEAAKTLNTVRGLVSTFQELKYVASYAMQWIYYYFQQRVAGPVSRLQKRLQDISDMLKKNIPSWGILAQEFVSGFVRLFDTAIETVERLAHNIGELPAGLKTVGAVLGTVFAASKMSPMMWFITALGGLLLMLDDFYTWQRNPEGALLGDFWASIADGTLLDGIAETISMLTGHIIYLLVI